MAVPSAVPVDHTVVNLQIFPGAGQGNAHATFVHRTGPLPRVVRKFLPAALVLAALVLGFFSNLFASTTHHGTGPAPVLFGSGHVELGTGWKLGAALSVVNLAIWLGGGAVWGKALGRW